MGRSKSKKLKRKIGRDTERSINLEMPIKNLPEKILRMHIKSGTRIKNVFGYALKEFPNYDGIMWIGIGQGIAKAISCAELFKRKHTGLHQITKLHSVNSKRSEEDTAVETRQVSELHILLTKDIKDTTELGYQAPGDCGEFLEKEYVEMVESKTSTTIENASNESRVDTKKFPPRRLKKGKSNSQDHNAEPLPKKKKFF